MGKIVPISDSELGAILDPELLALWHSIVQVIDDAYDMEKEWDKGGKGSKYLLRFRRGGKTLVTLIPSEDGIGLMVIYGKDERAKFEAMQASFSGRVVNEYQAAKTYHDGKWVMFNLPDNEVQSDLLRLLEIKRKPNRRKVS